MALTDKQIKNIIEAALFAADGILNVERLLGLFIEDGDRPTREQVQKALVALKEEYRERGVQLKEVSSGFRFQVDQDLAPWVSRLWEEKPPRYSRALLETLALIAYRQPITRAEIEEVRGVTVSSTIVKTLLERDWIKVVGHKEVPGRPALYSTTRAFLDYFNLKSLNELPSLAELKDLVPDNPELDLDGEGGNGSDQAAAPEAGGDADDAELASGDTDAEQADSEEETSDEAVAAATEESRHQPADSAESVSESDSDEVEDMVMAGEDDEQNLHHPAGGGSGSEARHGSA